MKLKPYLLISFLFATLPASIVTGQWVKTSGYGGTCLLCGGNNIFYSTGEELYFSTDYGISWTECGQTGGELSSLATSGQYLFAGGSSDLVGVAIYRSSDNGHTWTTIDSGLNLGSPATSYVFNLSQIGKNLFAGTSNGAFFSTNNGTSWNPLSAPSCDAFAADSLYFFGGTGDGVFRSSNISDSWVSVSNGLLNSGISSPSRSATAASSPELTPWVELITESFVRRIMVKAGLKAG
jgi:photosystem II stability/assembly factor-like uncharacterized protein